jgi:hypothetical protein
VDLFLFFCRGTAYADGMQSRSDTFLTMQTRAHDIQSQNKPGVSIGMILAVLALTLFTVALGVRIYIL